MLCGCIYVLQATRGNNQGDRVHAVVAVDSVELRKMDA